MSEQRIGAAEGTAGGSARGGGAARADGSARLDRGEIVRVAIALLDSHGLDAFSMRKLAHVLDIKSPSLYWHVRSKEELYDLIIDTVFGKCPLPEDPTVPWTERITTLAMSLRRVLLTHPAAARLLPGRIPAGPNSLRLADHAIGILRRAGFGDRTAARGYLTLHFYIAGFASLEVAYGKRAEGGVELADFGAFLNELPAGKYPDLEAVSGEILAGRLTDRFALGLAGVLDRLGAEDGAG